MFGDWISIGLREGDGNWMELCWFHSSCCFVDYSDSEVTSTFVRTANISADMPLDFS